VTGDRKTACDLTVDPDAPANAMLGFSPVSRRYCPLTGARGDACRGQRDILASNGGQSAVSDCNWHYRRLKE